MRFPNTVHPLALCALRLACLTANILQRYVCILTHLLFEQTSNPLYYVRTVNSLQPCTPSTKQNLVNQINCNEDVTCPLFITTSLSFQTRCKQCYMYKEQRLFGWIIIIYFAYSGTKIGDYFPYYNCKKSHQKKL